MSSKGKYFWQNLTIKKKIFTFAFMVFLIVAVSFVLDFWLVKFSVFDMRIILDDNVKTNNFVIALKQEDILFEQYMKNPNIELEAELQKAIRTTEQAERQLPFTYRDIGDERYATTWAIKNSYVIYTEARDAMLIRQEESLDYIQRLYEVYEMQDYLLEYAERLVNITLELGNERYQQKVPYLIYIPYIAVFFGFCLLFGVIELSNIMNKTIVVPIMKLVDAAKRIAGNDFFIEDVQVDNRDELGELVRAFNKMKYATGEYITALEEQRKTLDLLHEEELEKLEMEKELESIHLKLLRSQINPHFLFNTLNVIAGMANLEDAETTEKMINALSSLFRYNLNTPEAEVALARELKVVEDYMYLQQMRFGNRITYEISCEVDKERVMVPSFFLQPLVENAIIHGLAPKEEGGKIVIRLWEDLEVLRITINDTGVGMDEEKLCYLCTKLEGKDTQHQGIGLSNVYHRIMTLYQGSKVEVLSKSMEGTQIKIQIPMNRKVKME